MSGRFIQRSITDLILVAIIATLLPFSCSGVRAPQYKEDSRGVTSNEIVLGSSSALSGYASFLGTQYTHGSLAYFDEINKKGGIHGRKIRLICLDDQYDPPRAVGNTQKLINEEGVFILTDFVGTPTSVKIIDLVHKSQIPVVGFFTGAELLRTPFRPMMFHVRDSYYAEAEGAVSYFVDKLGLRQIGVFYQEDAFGLAVLTGVQLALQRRNLETVATATYVRGSMDLKDSVQIMKASGAQAVIMVGTYSPLAEFIKLSHSSGFTPVFHTVSFVGSEAFGKELIDRKTDPAQYSNIIVTQVVPSPFSEDLPAVREYRSLVRQNYPEDLPSYVALEGFVNAKVLVQALSDCGPELTRRKFREALESIHGLDVGIGKQISYDVLDHKGLEGIYYSRLNPDGTFRIFEP